MEHVRCEGARKFGRVEKKIRGSHASLCTNHTRLIKSRTSIQSHFYIDYAITLIQRIWIGYVARVT